MTADLIYADGTRDRLPELVEWELEYACGTPCDSFRVVSLWTCQQDERLAHAVRFEAFHQGEQVFAGVVDECEVSWSEQGCRMEISGRGMAALLLDNEAVGADYAVATVQDILRDHVTPYGVEVVQKDALGPVTHFRVSTGSSEWAVLYEFARYHGGVTPRFDRKGQLILGGWEDAVPRVIHDRVPVTRLCARDRRYGVISQVWVQERGKEPKVNKVVNQPFQADGGQCRRIYTMPGKSDHQTMRYQGDYQIRQSQREQLELEVDLALPFCVWPGELVRLERSGWGRNGLFRAAQVTVSMDAQGYGTHVVLVPVDTML